MFPTDAKTVYANYPASGGTTCHDLLSSVPYTRTFLYGSIRTDGANQGNISLGGNDYLDNNKNTDVVTIAPITFTNVPVSCTRASNKQFSYKVVYVDYDLTALSTTTPENTAINGFSYGDIMTIMILLFIFCLLFFNLIKEWVFGVKIDGVAKIRSDKLSR